MKQILRRFAPQNDPAWPETSEFVEIFIGIPVYKVFGIIASSSRDSVKVRGGFAGSEASEKPIPLPLQAASLVAMYFASFATAPSASPHPHCSPAPSRLLSTKGHALASAVR